MPEISTPAVVGPAAVVGTDLVDVGTTPRWRETASQPTLLGDAVTMMGRSVRLSRRNVEVLLTSLMLTVLLMLMFVYLFGGAVHTGTAHVS